MLRIYLACVPACRWASVDDGCGTCSSTRGRTCSRRGKMAWARLPTDRGYPHGSQGFTADNPSFLCPRRGLGLKDGPGSASHGNCIRF
jgi:hypothetical protein